MKEFNFPNFLTFFRLVAAPFVFILVLNDLNFYAVLLFLIAVTTDVFDGYLARRTNASTKFGKIVDPLADKLLYGFAIFSVLIKNQLYYWVAGFGVAVLFYIISYYLFVKKGMKITKLGRVVIFLESIVIVVLLAGFVTQWLLTVLAVLFIVPAVDYLFKVVKK